MVAHPLNTASSPTMIKRTTFKPSRCNRRSNSNNSSISLISNLSHLSNISIPDLDWDQVSLISSSSHRLFSHSSLSSTSLGHHINDIVDNRLHQLCQSSLDSLDSLSTTSQDLNNNEILHIRNEENSPRWELTPPPESPKYKPTTPTPGFPGPHPQPTRAPPPAQPDHRPVLFRLLMLKVNLLQRAANQEAHKSCLGCILPCVTENLEWCLGCKLNCPHHQYQYLRREPSSTHTSLFTDKAGSASPLQDPFQLRTNITFETFRQAHQHLRKQLHPRKIICFQEATPPPILRSTRTSILKQQELPESPYQGSRCLSPVKEEPDLKLHNPLHPELPNPY